jgi:hypothetical protein
MNQSIVYRLTKTNGKDSLRKNIISEKCITFGQQSARDYIQANKAFYPKNASKFVSIAPETDLASEYIFRKKIFLMQVSNVRLNAATEKCITSTTKATGAILTKNNAFFANCIFPKIKLFY